MKKIFWAFLLLISLDTAAESIPKDAGLWMTVSIDKKLTKRWSVGLDEEFRLFDNISRINLLYSNLGINYKVKSFKFSFVYRFITKNEDDLYFSKTHRLYFDASYRYKINDWSFSYRLRTQGQVSEYYSSENGKKVESLLRHKFEINYQLGKITPFIAAEFFYQLNNPTYKEGNNLFNRMRYNGGLNYEFNRVHSVGIYYLIQHDFNNKNNSNDYVIGVQYGLTL